MIYRQITRLFNKGTAFDIMMWITRIVSKIPGVRHINKIKSKKRQNLKLEAFGLTISNPVGLGAGLDKNCELYNAFTDYGFGFIIAGPINGTNVRRAIHHIQEDAPDEVLMICINKEHTSTFSLCYDFADAFVIEVQNENEAQEVLDDILEIRLAYETYKPVLLCIKKEHSDGELESIVNFCMMNGVDGFVAGPMGMVKRIHSLTKGRVPIIGFGGIHNPDSALTMLDSGATMVAVTTGMALEGPILVRRILRRLQKMYKTGHENCVKTNNNEKSK